MAWRPWLDEFDYTAPRRHRYLGSRGRPYSFRGPALQPSPAAGCDPFGIARSRVDTSQVPGRGVSFHPARLGRCCQTDTSRGSCPR